MRTFLFVHFISIEFLTSSNTFFLFCPIVYVVINTDNSRISITHTVRNIRSCTQAETRCKNCDFYLFSHSRHISQSELCIKSAIHEFVHKLMNFVYLRHSDRFFIFVGGIYCNRSLTGIKYIIVIKQRRFYCILYGIGNTILAFALSCAYQSNSTFL